MRRHGTLVAVEGIDGAGKTTLLRGLARSLRRDGRRVRIRKEPVDPTLGRLAQEAGARDPWTGAVYFTVDRHLAGPRLRSDLERYDVVLSDRSFYSTLAYQGSRLPVRDRRRLEQLQREATVVPDLVVLLDLPVSWLERRLRRRRGARSPLERARALAPAVRAYRRLARRGGWIVLDARQTSGEVARAARAALALRLPPVRSPKKLRAARGPPGPR